MSRKKDDKDKTERHSERHSDKTGHAGHSGIRGFMESSSIVPHKASRRASLPYRNVMDLAKALCKTCRQRRASYAAGVIMALPGIIQVTSPLSPNSSFLPLIKICSSHSPSTKFHQFLRRFIRSFFHRWQNVAFFQAFNNANKRELNWIKDDIICFEKSCNLRSWTTSWIMMTCRIIFILREIWIR